MMRVMLYEAAQSMQRSKKWSWLKAWAMQIARRLARAICIQGQIRPTGHLVIGRQVGFLFPGGSDVARGHWLYDP
jgi:hypothetical protein